VNCDLCGAATKRTRPPLCDSCDTVSLAGFEPVDEGVSPKVYALILAAKSVRQVCAAFRGMAA